MQSYFYLVIILLLGTKATGQEWFLDQDRWVYEYTDGFSGTQGYLEMKEIGDKLINGRNSKELVLEGRAYSQAQRDTMDLNPRSIFTYEDNGQVYVLENNTFRLRYDFNMEIGDSLYINIDDEFRFSHWIYLDSLSQIDQGGKAFQVQHFNLSDTARDWFGVEAFEVIEGIGAVTLFDFSISNGIGLFDVPSSTLCHFSRDSDTLGNDLETCISLPEPRYDEFAPIGAKWYVELLGLPDYEGTVKYESLRDTTVNGKDCRILHKSDWSTSVPLQGEFILHQQYGKIYHYIAAIDSFNLVMNFLAKPGDSWKSFDLGNSYTAYDRRSDYIIEVDSTSSEFITDNPVPLYTQHVSIYALEGNQKTFIRNDVIYDKIGFRNSMLPDSGGHEVDDDVWEGKIRCYSDNRTNYQFSDADCLITSTSEPSIENLVVYPNPVSNNLKIKSNNDLSISIYRIINQVGSIVQEGKIKSEIAITNLPSGIYFFNILLEDQSSINRVIIKV